MEKDPTDIELVARIKKLEEQIQKHQQTEEALRENEARLSLALELTSEGIWDWDVKSGVTYASQRCSEIFGVKEDSQVSPPTDTWASRIHPDDYERVRGCLEDHLEGKGPFDVVYRHRHESGGYRWQHARGKALLDENNHVYRMVGSISDITEQKHSEEERARLEARVEQARKMEALGNLAGGLAHDFNNLLTAILGNIELSQLEGRSMEQVNRNLVNAKKACKRAKDLNRLLISFAKGGDPDMRPGSLGKIIQDSAMGALSDRETKCEFSLPQDLCLVSFDAKQIRDAITNFVINASEAMDEKGVVRISAENVESISDQKRKAVRISIQDHGKGIEQENLGRIFDPYFSSKALVTQKGLGLGLSVSYSIIKKHDGHIEVESQAGTGTTFHIYLPADREQSAA
jgi:PAS domain S-box-containing protein